MCSSCHLYLTDTHVPKGVDGGRWGRIMNTGSRRTGTLRVEGDQPRPLLQAGVKTAPEVRDQQDFRKWFPGFRQNVHVMKTDINE